MMKMFLMMTIALIQSPSAFAEVTTAMEQNYYATTPAATRSADEARIASHVQKAISNLKEATNYLFVNKCEKGDCTTHVVQLVNGSGWKMIDKFPTVKGSGTSLGCGSTMTEPGLFKVAANKAKPKNNHPNWGEQAYLAMEPLPTSLNRCGKHDVDKVIHGRKDAAISGSSAGNGRTNGCVGVNPQRFQQMSELSAKGAVIYNVGDDVG